MGTYFRKIILETGKTVFRYSPKSLEELTEAVKKTKEEYKKGNQVYAIVTEITDKNGKKLEAETAKFLDDTVPVVQELF